MVRLKPDTTETAARGLAFSPFRSRPASGGVRFGWSPASAGPPDSSGVRLPAGPRDSGGVRLEAGRSEEHTSELQSLAYLVCRLLLEKKKDQTHISGLAASVLLQ